MVAVAMVPVQGRDGDAAGHDAVVIFFELLRALVDPGLDSLGTVEVPERNLQGELHGRVSWLGPFNVTCLICLSRCLPGLICVKPGAPNAAWTSRGGMASRLDAGQHRSGPWQIFCQEEV